MHSYLIGFHRESAGSTATEYLPDLGEQVGRWGLGWLSLGFGKSVKVTQLGGENHVEASFEKSAAHFSFEKEIPPLWQRVSAIVTAILLFPVSLLLAGIGCIGLACSESHAKMSIDYQALKTAKKLPIQKRVYHSHPQTLNFDSARQSQIEALRSDRRSPSPSGKGEEEDQFGKVAASQNSKFEGDCGIKEGVSDGSKVSQTVGIAQNLGKADKPVSDNNDSLLNKGLNNTKKHLSERIIPPECDIRGSKWLWNDKHLHPYARDYIHRTHSEIYFTGMNNIGSMGTQLHVWTRIKKNLPEKLAFFLIDPLYDNHWTLVYICSTTRTINFYDPKVCYGDYKGIIKQLEDLGKKLDAFNPGEKPYQVFPKIKICLQPDIYQCGPWVLYFLEEVAKDPNVDFNALNIDDAQSMIAKYRLHVMDRLIELHEAKSRETG